MAAAHTNTTTNIYKYSPFIFTQPRRPNIQQFLQAKSVIPEITRTRPTRGRANFAQMSAAVCSQVGSVGVRILISIMFVAATFCPATQLSCYTAFREPANSNASNTKWFCGVTLQLQQQTVHAGRQFVHVRWLKYRRHDAYIQYAITTMG